MTRIGWGKVLAGVAGVAAAGAAWLYLREKSVETPPHSTEETEGPFEIRTYPALVMAETSQPGGHDRALGNGFGLLADYAYGELRGAGDAGAPLIMTAPIFVAPAACGWTVRIALPAGIEADAAPVPGEGVKIVTIPARRMAVLRFGGRADDAALVARETELRDWMAGRGFRPKGKAEHGIYDSPLMPGPLRHNEVMFEIR